MDRDALVTAGDLAALSKRFEACRAGTDNQLEGTQRELRALTERFELYTDELARLRATCERLQGRMSDLEQAAVDQFLRTSDQVAALTSAVSLLAMVAIGEGAIDRAVAAALERAINTLKEHVAENAERLQKAKR